MSLTKQSPPHDELAAGDDVVAWHGIYSLETRYWRDVDTNEGRGAHEFYIADGVFAVGHNRFQGRVEIQKFYDWRRTRRLMTTRHLISNLQIISGNNHHATATGTISFHHAEGRPPVMETQPCILIADLHNECVRNADGLWRFKSHILQPVFVGDDVPLSLAIDLNR